MKTLQTCPTKASTPLKDSKQFMTITSLSDYKQRRKSLTVYSAVKNANNQTKESVILKDQINKPKVHLKLLQSPKKDMYKVDSEIMSRKQETGGVMIKMNFCGPKGCDISVQNSYKFFDDTHTQKQSHQKKSRVLYESKRQPSSVSESEINNSIEFKLKNLPENQQMKNKFNLTNHQQKLQNFKQQQYKLYSIQKNLSSNQRYGNLDQKELKYLGAQRLNDDFLLGGISNISNKNETKLHSKQEHTKNDSFSIRHFSSSGHPLSSSFLNSTVERAQQNIQNFDKLKQIYRNPLKSNISEKQNHSNIFYYQSPQVQSSQKEHNQSLKINIKNIGKKQTFQSQDNFNQFNQSCQYQSPLNSSRTIIQILNDWDCKSDLYQLNQQKDRLSKPHENPQNLSRISFSKKTYQQ